MTYAIITLKFPHGAEGTYREGFIFYSAGSSAARSYPVSLVYSGYYFWGGGYLWNQGSASLYWLSQATEPNNVEYAYYLRITDIDMNPRSTIGKTLGLALRLRLHFRA